MGNPYSGWVLLSNVLCTGTALRVIENFGALYMFSLMVNGWILEITCVLCLTCYIGSYWRCLDSTWSICIVNDLQIVKVTVTRTIVAMGFHLVIGV